MAAEWTVERHLRDKSEQVVDLYRRFIELVEGCGPFAYAVVKTAITLKGSERKSRVAAALSIRSPRSD